MRLILVLLLLFSACTRSGTKQSGIASIERRLEKAQIDLALSRERVEQLQDDLRRAKVASIAKNVEEFESALTEVQSDPEALRAFVKELLPSLFEEERRILCSLIDVDPEGTPREQLLLNRILRMITDLSVVSWEIGVEEQSKVSGS